jgi:hypothetical protein
LTLAYCPVVCDITLHVKVQQKSSADQLFIVPFTANVDCREYSKQVWLRQLLWAITKPLIMPVSLPDQSRELPF